MNYVKIYDQLIANAVNRDKPVGYVEKHHIHPKSLGGSNQPDNIVYLTAREHYIAHALLVKKYKQIGDKHAYEKMIYAFWFLSKTTKHERRVTSTMYEQARLLFSERNPNKDDARKLQFLEKHKQGLYKYDYDKVSKTLKHTLSSLSKEDMLKRMSGAHNCDHQSRVDAIRRGKSSTLKMTDMNGIITVFHSYDDVKLITGYFYNTIKVLIRTSSSGIGILQNGNRVEYVVKYEGKNRWTQQNEK